MTTPRDRWNKLAKSKKYREEFVSAQVKRGIPFQIRRLLKQKGLSQQELANRAKIAQGVVSRAADPEYGNLTLNTIIRIAAGFDVAFLGKFVPFSELDRWFGNLSEEPDVKTFDEEDAERATPKPPQLAAGAADYGIGTTDNPTQTRESFNVIQGGAQESVPIARQRSTRFSPVPARAIDSAGIPA